MSRLDEIRQAAAVKEIADAEAALRLPHPRQRLDLGLALVLATTALVGTAGAWLAASWLDVSGRLDPPVIAAVEDPRILTDYRDNPSPMVDLVALGSDLLIGRQDGSIDRYDTEGRLFATESLPRNASLSGDLALLSVDCAEGECAGGQPETAFALTGAGGLAARRGAEWQVVLGDMAFVGADGVPVEQADLQGWAVSGDGTLVLADGGEKGLGLFDQSDGSWQIGQAVSGVTHGPLFHQGAFWLGSPAGLYRMTTSGGRAQWPRGVMPGTEGEVLDLTPGPGQSGLLVLRRAACADGGSGCLALLQIGPGGDVVPLMQEIEAHPDLDDSGLKHVVMQGADLLTLGSAGVHRYEAAARRWRRIDPQEPTTWFAETGGQKLHIALPDRVITLSGGRIVAEVTLESPVVQVLPGDGNVLFGLDRQGRILRLAAPAASVLSPADIGAPADVRFSAALGLDQLFVALGPEGALIHDSRARRYSFVPPQAMPPLPLADAMLVPGDGGQIWLVSRADGRVWSLTVEGEFPDKRIAAEAHGGAGVPVAQARRNGGTLELVGRQGQVLRLAGDGSFAALAGDPLPGRFTPVSVASNGSQFTFTDGRALWAYRPDERGWFGPVDAPKGARLTDLAYGSGQMLGLDNAGMVHSLSGAAWEAVSGGPQKAAFGSEELQDAMTADTSLYLAADDQLQRYLPLERRFDQLWHKPGRGAEILTVTSGVPLWTNSSGVYRGDQQIYGGPNFVDGWLGASGPVAMGQIGPGGGAFFLAGPGGCLYLGQPAPKGEIRDVVQLDVGRLLVRTASGAGIYEPELHRWLKISLPGLTSQSRLLRLGGHLVRLEPDGLASIPITDILQIDSCEGTDVAIDWPVTSRGLQASLVDGTPEVLVLSNEGGLRRWRDGNFVTEAAAPGAGPKMDRVMRAYPHGQGVVALTPDALWRYDLPTRRWREWQFEGAPARVSQIDLVLDGEGVSLTLWDSDAVPMGAWSDLKGDTIGFVPLRRPVLPLISMEPDEIRDLASFDGRIVIMSERQLLLYPEGAEAADLEIALPAPQEGWHLASDPSGALVLFDGDPAAPRSIYRIEPDMRGRSRLDQAAARYMPGDDRAHAIVSEAGSARLLRVDRKQNTWSCEFKVGSEPECTLLTGPPIALSSDEVVAFDSGQGVLLTSSAIGRVDRASRPVSRIAGPEVSDAGRLLRNGTALLYWEGPGRALWNIGGSKAEVIFSATQAIRVAGSDLAVLVSGQVEGLRDGRLVAADMPRGVADEQIVRHHFAAGGQVLALASGGVSAAEGAQVSDPLLVFASDAVTVLPVPSGGGNQAEQWLESGADGGLLLRFVAQCELPTPMPAIPPPEFIGPLLPPVIAPPVITPCAQDISLPLRVAPGEFLMDLARDRDGALQVLTNLRDVTLDVSGASVAAEAPAALAETPKELREGRPPGGFRVVDGRSWLNPPGIEQGYLLGGTSQRRLSLLKSAALPAFDAGWLSWQRDERQIRFGEGAQSLDLPLSEAIVGGRFLPAGAARALRLPGGDVAWIAASGLWHQQEDRMRPVLLRRQDLPRGIDQGHFLGPQEQIAADNGDVAAVQPARNFSAGGMDLTVDPLVGRVAATISVAGQVVTDAADRGFLHDRRLSVAQSGGEAYFLTPVGLIPLRDLSGGAAAAPGSRRLAAEGGAILAETVAGWLRRTLPQAAWSPSGTPFQNALMAEESGRRWELRDGAVAITSADAWRIARQGLDFDTDQLLGFAATPDVAVAVTRAGTHAARDLAGLAGATAPVAVMPSGLPLDSRRGKGGKFILHTSQGRIWDVGGWRDAAADERPWQSRHAAAIDGISVEFDPAPRLSVAARTIGDDGAARLAFAWRRGDAMPFDEVTAIHADAGSGALLVGTRLGMRVLSPSGDGYTNGVIRVPSRAGEAVAAGVVAAGRPDSRPDRIEVAFAGGACAFMPALTDLPQPCAAGASVQTRFVASGDFWHVSKAADSVRWAYLIDGQERPLTHPMGGHLPHDLLADRVDCAGVMAEQWLGSSVLRIGRHQLDLPGLRGLHCQPTTARLDGGAILQAGLYALLPAGGSRFDGSAFAAVPGVEAAALADRLAGRVVLETGQLRYGLEGGAPVAEHLSLAGRWQATPWSDGRLALDQPRALAWRGGLQTVTDAGVVAAPGGVLDPKALVVMAGADPSTLVQCGTLRAESLDGRSHGLQAARGAPLRLYCRDGSWLEGVTDGRRDGGTFQAASPTPTTRDLFAVDGLWSAKASYGADGMPATIAMTFRDEPARLGAGRFDFDMLHEIAAPFSGQVELLTDSGWWRAPAADIALRETERPVASLAPRTVTGFTKDLSRRSGDAGLCITAADGTARFWAGGAGLEAAGSCRDDRGRDALWQWWQEGGQPRAFANSLNGVLLERSLVAGRFSDVVLSGPPLVGKDGAIMAPGGQGVLVLDPLTGVTRGIYALDPAGVLTRTLTGDPVWLDRAGPVLLAGETRALPATELACPGLSAIPGQLSEGNSLLRLRAGGPGWEDALILGTGTRMQALIDCQDPAQSRLWSSRHDVSGHSRSLSLGASRVELLQIGLVPGGAVLSDGVKEAAVTDGPDVAQRNGLATVRGGEELYVIDGRQLLAVSLAPAISHLAETGKASPPSQPPPAPPSPDPAPARTTASAGSVATHPTVKPPESPPAQVPDTPPPPQTPAASATSAQEEPPFDAAAVQTALARALSRRIVVDGILGPRSRAAIADWQRQIGSEDTGFLSAGQLLDLLAEGAP